MSVLKYFKNIPRSPPIGRQTLIVIFFSNSQRDPWQKKKNMSPIQRGTGSSSREAIEERGYPSMHGVERVL